MAMHTSNEPVGSVATWGAPTSVSSNDMNFVYHAGLTTTLPSEQTVPWIAQKVPTISDGDWKLLPDGGMELTWKLRPDVKWHDGAPLTSKDFALGMEIRLDPSLAITQVGVEQVSAVGTPDDQTLVISYKAPYIYANVSQPGQIRAVPAHLMEEPYRRGMGEGFLNLPYWHSDFVGLGPYKLGDWVLGSQMEAVAFDGYFLGRPKIDRLIMRYFGDVNVMYAALNSGDIDIVPMGAFQADFFARIKQEYEGGGKGTALAVFAGTRNYKFQFRYPELPWSSDVRIRRALTHMLDRQALSDNLVAGQGGLADTVVSPTNPVYPILKEMGLPAYPYDPAQAQRLMAEAGWQKGVDGLYRSATGETMPLNIAARDTAAGVLEVQAIASLFAKEGIDATSSTTGKAGAGTLRNEEEATNRGLFGLPLREAHTSFVIFKSNQTATAPRWLGSNNGAYSNPEYDRLYDASLLAFDVNERNRLWASALKILAEDAMAINLFYHMAMQTIVFRTGVRGPGLTSTEQLAAAWNIHTWEMD
jgi:peptide/nickel transport system substrate-binding protein